MLLQSYFYFRKTNKIIYKRSIIIYCKEIGGFMTGMLMNLWFSRFVNKLRTVTLGNSLPPHEIVKETMFAATIHQKPTRKVALTVPLPFA